MRSEITASLAGRPVAAVQVTPLSVDYEAVPLLVDHTNPDPPAAIAMEPGPAEAPAGAVTRASMLCRRRRTRLRSAAYTCGRHREEMGYDFRSRWRSVDDPCASERIISARSVQQLSRQLRRKVGPIPRYCPVSCADPGFQRLGCFLQCNCMGSRGLDLRAVSRRLSK